MDRYGWDKEASDDYLDRLETLGLITLRKENIEDFLKNTKEEYYQPRGLPLAAEVCISTEAAGVLV